MPRRCCAPAPGALSDQVIGQKPRADPVGIDRADADVVRPMLNRVLAREEKGGGFRQAISPEIRTRVHRLLARVEQEHAAGALLLHDPDGMASDGLMGEEIELETLA